MSAIKGVDYTYIYPCFKASERNRNVILDLKPSKVEAKANGPPPVIHKQV